MEPFTILCHCGAEGDSLEQICALCLWLLMSPPGPAGS